MESIDDFYIDLEEPQQGCLLALRSIILKQSKDMTETRKYGMPCFCYKKKIVCYLWIDRKTEEPYILFVEGNKLDFPELEKGSRSRMKILRVAPNEDIPILLIEEILQKALSLYQE